MSLLKRTSNITITNMLFLCPESTSFLLASLVCLAECLSAEIHSAPIFCVLFIHRDSLFPLDFQCVLKIIVNTMAFRSPCKLFNSPPSWVPICVSDWWLLHFANQGRPTILPCSPQAQVLYLWEEALSLSTRPTYLPVVYGILAAWNAPTIPLQILPILQSLIQILSLQDDLDPCSPCCSRFPRLESFNNSTPSTLGPTWSVYASLLPQSRKTGTIALASRSSLWGLAAHSALASRSDGLSRSVTALLRTSPLPDCSEATALGQWLPWNIATKGC